VEQKGEVIYGIIGCSCSEYPVLGGVGVLRREKETKRAVESLRKKHYLEALNHAIKWERFPGFSDLIKNPMGFLLGITNFVNSAPRSANALNLDTFTFTQIIKKLGLGRFGNYLIHRFSLHTFWNTYALLPLVYESEGPILDFGCGAGHSSFVFSHFFQPRNHFCVDVNLLNLILTKKYFANAQTICVSSTATLPFKDNFFSTVFSLDCFHYVKFKSKMAQEFERVLGRDGTIIMPHLHNSLMFNIAAGNPLRGSDYSKLFKDSNIKTFPEDVLLKSFLFKNSINLDKTYSDAEVDSSRSVTVVAGAPKRLKNYSGVKRYIRSMTNFLIVNPLYESVRTNEKYIFNMKYPRHRGFTDYSFLEEYYLTDKILPKRIAIKREIVESINTKLCDSDKKIRDDLIDSFVLINAPRRY